MIALLLAILSSTLIAVIMRLSTGRVTGKRSMLAANYLVCALFSALFMGAAQTGSGTETALGLGGLNGALYLASFMAMQQNTEKNGMVLSSVFMKLGLLVPMVVSVAAFREIPTGLQIAGFLLALVAIFVINFRGKGKGRFGMGLVLLLLLSGSADAMSKVYERLGNAALSDLFLLCTFASAFVLCVICIWIGRERPRLQDLCFGFLIGIPNFFSSRFLLDALRELPAVVVYPTFSVATMLLVTLSGVLFFRERLPRHQWLALGLILISLALLNIG